MCGDPGRDVERPGLREQQAGGGGGAHGGCRLPGKQEHEKTWRPPRSGACSLHKRLLRPEPWAVDVEGSARMLTLPQSVLSEVLTVCKPTPQNPVGHREA